jgi:hypothetical protein
VISCFGNVPKTHMSPMKHTDRKADTKKSEMIQNRTANSSCFQHLELKFRNAKSIQTDFATPSQGSF